MVKLILVWNGRRRSFNWCGVFRPCIRGFESALDYDLTTSLNLAVLAAVKPTRDVEFLLCCAGGLLQATANQSQMQQFETQIKPRSVRSGDECSDECLPVAQL